MDKSNKHETLDEKLFFFVYFRVYYQRMYKNSDGAEVDAGACLAPPDPEIIEIARYVLAWALSGISWDVFKICISKLQNRIREKRSNTGQIEKVLSNERSLDKFIGQIKEGLVEFSELPASTQEKVLEEVRVHYYTDEVIKLHKLAKESNSQGPSPELLEEASRLAKTAQKKCDIKFSEEEKEMLASFAKDIAEQ